MTEQIYISLDETTINWLRWFDRLTVFHESYVSDHVFNKEWSDISKEARQGLNWEFTARMEISDFSNVGIM